MRSKFFVTRYHNGKGNKGETDLATSSLPVLWQFCIEEKEYRDGLHAFCTTEPELQVLIYTLYGYNFYWVVSPSCYKLQLCQGSELASFLIYSRCSDLMWYVHVGCIGHAKVHVIIISSGGGIHHHLQKLDVDAPLALPPSRVRPCRSALGRMESASAHA